VDEARRADRYHDRAYEPTNDELFGYKGPCGRTLPLRDEAETGIEAFAAHLQEIRKTISADAKFPQIRSRRAGADSCRKRGASHRRWRARRRTAAFNLPIDERIVRAMGSKRVMFEKCAGGEVFEDSGTDRERVLPEALQSDLDFDAFSLISWRHE